MLEASTFTARHLFSGRSSSTSSLRRLSMTFFSLLAAVFETIHLPSLFSKRSW